MINPFDFAVERRGYHKQLFSNATTSQEFQFISSPVHLNGGGFTGSKPWSQDTFHGQPVQHTPHAPNPILVQEVEGEDQVLDSEEPEEKPPPFHSNSYSSVTEFSDMEAIRSNPRRIAE